MVQRQYPKSPLLGVATAIFREEHVLLVQRAKAPNAGQWALPGGLVKVGETMAEAAVREVHEETGLAITTPQFLTFEEILLRDTDGLVKHHYVLGFHAVESLSGTAQAGSDAHALGWFATDELQELTLTGSTKNIVALARAALQI